MGWFDDNGIDGYMPMEQGGVAGAAGGQPVAPPLFMNNEMGGQAQMPADGGAPAPAGQPGVSWLDWIDKTYGDDKTHGTGFAGLPQGTNLQQVVQRYNQETGANANYLGGKSGDQVDFGRGAEDVLTSGGQLWQAHDPKNPNAGGGAPAPQGGPGDGASMPTSFKPSGDVGGGAFAMPAMQYNGGGAQGGWDGTKFTPGAIDLPTDYRPEAISGPQNYSPERVTTPGALTAQQIAAADPYKATTAADMENDPGYAVRMKTTLGALQGTAAAKGLLRSGGTLQDIQAKAGEQASEEFANVDARRYRDYTTGLSDRLNVGTANNAANAQAYGLSNQFRQAAETTNAGNSLAAWQAYQGMRQNADQFNASRQDTAAQNNFSNRFSAQNANNANSLAAYQANTNAQLGQGNLNLGYTQAGNSFALGQGQLALGNKSADQSYDLGLRNNNLGYYSAGNAATNAAGQLGLGWANYGLNADNQQFNQGYSLADMGLRAAGQVGNAAAGYGAASGNNATQAGNAAASGTVGSANAWNAGITGAAGSAMDAYTAWLKGRQ